MVYINAKYNKVVETVDHFDTWKEARAALPEYQMSDKTTEYYISPRCTKEWAESCKTKETS